MSQQSGAKRKNSNLFIPKQSDQKSQLDKYVRDLSCLLVRQRIRVLDQGTTKWSPAVVTQRCVEPKSYIVQTPSGKSLRRNRKHLREDKSTATMNPRVSTPPPVVSPESTRNSIVGVTNGMSHNNRTNHHCHNR